MLGKASNIIENGKTLTEKVKQTLANMNNDIKLKYCIMQYILRDYPVEVYGCWKVSCHYKFLTALSAHIIFSWYEDPSSSMSFVTSNVKGYGSYPLLIVFFLFHCLDRPPGDQSILQAGRRYSSVRK